MNLKRIIYVGAILLMGLGLASCAPTKIGDILADPGAFRGKEVSIAGTVTNSMGGSIGPISAGAYEIDDGTGKLWVISEKRGAPSRGARVGVKGHVSQSVTIMGRNFATVVQESDRRAEKSVQ
jgi:hypothetical protein